MNEVVRNVGKPIPRYDGPLKVTGGAKYAAEFGGTEVLHGYVASAKIAKGRILAIDTRAARAVPGVVAIFTHENSLKGSQTDKDWQDMVAPPGVPLHPLGDDRVMFAGQPIAMVVADTFEAARYAATLIAADYAEEPYGTDLYVEQAQSYDPPEKREGVPPPPDPRGDAKAEFDKAPIKVREHYGTAIEHHNPMELFAAAAFPTGDGGVKVYEKTQGVQNTQAYLQKVFGLAKDKVEVLSPFMGGGFGSGLRPQYSVFLAVMGALELKRPVKVVLDRTQMYTFGYRPQSIQTVGLAADHEGRLTAILHDAIANTSAYEDYQEGFVNFTGLLYDCANADVTYRLAKLDLATPQDMRAPGAVLGVYALEVAMDELAYAGKFDPLQLRLANYSEKDENEGKPYTSKELRECYRQGAERFGWSNRSHAPRSMRDGKALVGWGMATGVWEAFGQPTGARATLTADGKLTVGNATSDIGTGTYTILQQIASDALGLPLADVSVILGDSAWPDAPPAGGSWTAASSGSAVTLACEAVKTILVGYARAIDNSPLANLAVDQITCSAGHLVAINDPSRVVSFAEAMRAGGVDKVEETAMFTPDAANAKKFSRYTHSAVFVEVKIDEELGVLRLTRVVSAIAAGKILNPSTARSQIIGGITFGIGMALEEETMIDHRLGRIMNRNLGEYHIPVHADIHDLDVLFVDEDDRLINPIGVKGLGEIGTVGTAAAIGNAIFHATGRRLRHLPMTIDQIMD